MIENCKNLKEYLQKLADDVHEKEVSKILNDPNHKIWKRIIKEASNGNYDCFMYISRYESEALRKCNIYVSKHDNNWCTCRVSWRDREQDFVDFMDFNTDSYGAYL